MNERLTWTPNYKWALGSPERHLHSVPNKMSSSMHGIMIAVMRSFHDVNFIPSYSFNTMFIYKYSTTTFTVTIWFKFKPPSQVQCYMLHVDFGNFSQFSNQAIDRGQFDGCEMGLGDSMLVYPIPIEDTELIADRPQHCPSQRPKRTSRALVEFYPKQAVGKRP